jgi:hypothetical protein
VPSAISTSRARRAAFTRGLRAQGLTWPQIAARIQAQENVNKLVAMRWAHDYSQWDVAIRWNELWPSENGTAGLNDKHVSGWENWTPLNPPRYTVEPSVPTLKRLARIYECDVSDLADDVSYSHLDQARQAGSPATEPQPETIAAAGSGASTMPGTEVAAATVAGAQGGWVQVPAPVPPGFAYREMKDAEPGPGENWMLQEVIMAAAHEGGEHAERAEYRDIGDATLEQIRADVIRLSHDYMTGEPFALFREMRRVRARMYAALDRSLWPRDQTYLYFLLGCLSDLMAVAAYDLGNSPAGEELIRAGWAYAVAIDHRPLMAQLRLQLASMVTWPQPRRSREYAANGLEYLSAGPNAVQLHLLYGRAAARVGDAAAARRAIASAMQAREREYSDELLEIGGEFDLSQASQHSLAGSALIEIPGAESEAAGELERAADLYGAGPQQGESHRYTLEARARIDLATARLRGDQLDAATDALAPVLSLPAVKRTTGMLHRLTVVRRELAQPRYQGSAEAAVLDEQIEAFLSDTIVGDLRELPSAS